MLDIWLEGGTRRLQKELVSKLCKCLFQHEPKILGDSLRVEPRHVDSRVKRQQRLRIAEPVTPQVHALLGLELEEERIRGSLTCS